MSHKSKKVRGRFGGHICPSDVLEGIEKKGAGLPGKMHEKAEKPSKLPKKVRGSPKESYYPMHGGRGR